MEAVKELLYSKTHEWVKLDGGKAIVGLTEYAHDQMGQIVFVDLPKPGKEVKAGEALAEVESVKAVSEVICPVSGRVDQVNEELKDNPDALNEDIYGSWLFEIELSDPSELEELIDAAAYDEFCEKL